MARLRPRQDSALPGENRPFRKTNEAGFGPASLKWFLIYVLGLLSGRFRSGFFFFDERCTLAEASAEVG